MLTELMSPLNVKALFTRGVNLSHAERFFVALSKVSRVKNFQRTKKKTQKQNAQRTKNIRRTKFGLSPIYI